MNTLVIDIDGDIWEVHDDSNNSIEFAMGVLQEQYDLDDKTVDNILFMYYDGQLENLLLDA